MIQSNIIVLEQKKVPSINSISSSSNLENIKPYLNDESNIFQGNAEKVFFPTNSLEVASIVKEASFKKIKITVSGAGTGLTASRVPRGGWIVATENLNSVEHYPEENSKIWKDPETNKEIKYNILENDSGYSKIRVPVSLQIRSLHKLAKSLGYFYPPDTTEWSSFIGGNIATNASGARSFKYGSTRKYVKGLKVVLSNGEILNLNPNQKADKNLSWILRSNSKEKTINVKSLFPYLDVSKNAIGFPLYESLPFYELFIGTEGIFGIITEVILQLIPYPKNIFSIITFFKSREEALEFVQFAKNQKIKDQEPIPLSVEYFDYYSLQLIKRKYKKIPSEANAAVYLEQDVDNKIKIESYFDFWGKKLETIDCIDTWAELDSEGINVHKDFRHTLPVSVNSIVRRYQVSKVGTDFAVPKDRFKEFLDLHFCYGNKFLSYQEKLRPLQGIEISYVVYGHIGNDHLHMNFLPRDKNELEMAKELHLEMIKKIVDMNGTVSAEHGVGKKKYDRKPLIYYQIGEKGILRLKELKKILDPSNILNRGNLFD